MVSVVVPTRGRPHYLAHTLDSLEHLESAHDLEIVVVCDGPQPRSLALARARGARVVELPVPSGLNAARNAGIEASEGALVAFIDDDVELPAGWLQALRAGAAAYPSHEVFGGPIRARLEGGPRRVCGREPPPVTTLDLGPVDRDARLVWGANLAVRRSAFARLGPFDSRLSGRGDEEEWLLRYTAAGGRIRYLAAAGLIHRRDPHDAQLATLIRTAYAHGRAARRHDARAAAPDGRAAAPDGRAAGPPPLSRELRTLAGCLWHVARRRCAFGLTMAAHSAGRLAESLSPR